MVDVLLSRPLADVLNELVVPSEVTHALLRGDGSRSEQGTPSQEAPLAHLLALAIAFERGDWADIGRMSARVGIGEATAGDLYADARRWADELQLSTTPKSL